MAMEVQNCSEPEGNIVDIFFTFFLRNIFVDLKTLCAGAQNGFSGNALINIYTSQSAVSS